MPVDPNLESFVKNVTFSSFLDEEIRAISVLEVSNPKTIDKDFKPAPKGLHDSALGPVSFKDYCYTCGKSYYNCPGHLGHIELPLLVYNPSLIKILFLIMKGSCIFCYRLLSPVLQSFLLRIQMKLISEGNMSSVRTLKDNIVNNEALKQFVVTHDNIHELEKFVMQLIPPSNEKNHIKDGNYDKNTFATRSELLMEYIKKWHTSTIKSCPHCRSRLPTWKNRDNGTKIYLNFIQKRTSVAPSTKLPNTPKTPLSTSNESSLTSQIDKNHLSALRNWETHPFIFISFAARGDQELSPIEAKLLLIRIFAIPENVLTLCQLFGCLQQRLPFELNEDTQLNADHIEALASVFFLKALPVVPNKFRPLNVLEDSKFITSQTLVYVKVLAACQLLNEIMKVDPSSLLPLTLKSNSYRDISVAGNANAKPITNESNNDLDTTTLPPAVSQNNSTPNSNSNAVKRRSSGLKLAQVDRMNSITRRKKGGGPGAFTVYPTGGSNSTANLPAFVSVWRYLQSCVNLLLHPDTVMFPKERLMSLKQVLEKKEGLFRKHMMGKRVDFAARSVISPDPFINIDQIGVPLIFAIKLTFPERVTPFNASYLRKAILNGPQQYPGAFSVQMSSGDVIMLDARNSGQRRTIARKLAMIEEYGYEALYNLKDCQNLNSLHTDTIVLVNRHIKDGDMLLVNRQPTLHKPSIMAHKAKILPGQKTLRLHYAQCKAYNADFDGDEMNAHFPQNYLGVAEARYIAGCQDNYLTPKDGTPLTGLIQDHLIAGVLLSQKGQFFCRRDYMSLICKALADLKLNTMLSKLLFLPPCIIKPYPMWSGKQIISTILLNVLGAKHYGLFKMGNDKGKVSESMYAVCDDSAIIEFTNQSTLSIIRNDKQYQSLLSENSALIRQGYWVKGVFDKAHFGASAYGLVHCCQELLGGQIASNLLTALGKLFTSFLQIYGFSLGIRDLLVKEKADKKRSKSIKTFKTLAPSLVKEIFGNQNQNDQSSNHDSAHDNWKQAFYDRDQYKLAEWEIKCKQTVNQTNNQITDNIMGNGLIRSFPKNNLILMVNSGAKGTLVNCMQICCALGQIELEGKRPPVMASGRSLPSFVAFDEHPRSRGFIPYRFLTGLKPPDYFFHCMAGREGLIDTAVKTSHSGYLQRCLIKQLEGVTVNYDNTVRDADGSLLQFLYGEDGLEVVKCQYLTKKAQTDFLLANTAIFPINKTYKKMALKNGKIVPISEKFMGKILENYSQTQHSPNSQQLQYDARDFPAQFRDIKKYFRLKNSICSASPGEAVGLLAAQSIGEPSTQMTLNTFHFAGRGEMNVTLGIPRLCELLMRATRDQKTPFMSVPIDKEKAQTYFSQNENVQFVNNMDNDIMSVIGQNLQLIFSRVAFSKVLEKVNIREKIEAGFDTKGRRRLFWIYDIDFHILSPRELIYLLPHHSKLSIDLCQLEEKYGSNNNYHDTKHDKQYKLYKKLSKKMLDIVAQSILRNLELKLVKAIKKEDVFLNTFKLFEIRRRMMIDPLSKSSSKKGNNENENGADDDGDDTNEGSETRLEQEIKNANKKRASASNNNGRDSMDSSDNEEPGNENSDFSDLDDGEDSFKKRNRRFYNQNGQNTGTEGGETSDWAAGTRVTSKGFTSGALTTDDDEELRPSQSEGYITDDLSLFTNTNLDNSETDAKIKEKSKRTLTTPNGSRKKSKLTSNNANTTQDGEMGNEGDNSSIDGENMSTIKKEQDDDQDSLTDYDDDQIGFDEETDDVNNRVRSSSVTSGVISGDATEQETKSKKDPKMDQLEVFKDQLEEFKDTLEVQMEIKDDYVSKSFYDKNANDQLCRITLQTPLSENKIDIEALLFKECQNNNVYELPGIYASNLADKDGQKVINIEGTNLTELFKYGNILDLNKLHTNDLHKVHEIYGIEACRNAIIKEVKNVFSVYGINVDYRHLSLLADAMTASGSYKGFNRFTLASTNTSPLLKMSFESTTLFLLDAFAKGLTDNLENPSANLVIGNQIKAGTGCFDLFQNIAL